MRISPFAEFRMEKGSNEYFLCTHRALPRLKSNVRVMFDGQSLITCAIAKANKRWPLKTKLRAEARTTFGRTLYSIGVMKPRRASPGCTCTGLSSRPIPQKSRAIRIDAHIAG